MRLTALGREAVGLAALRLMAADPLGRRTEDEETCYTQHVTSNLFARFGPSNRREVVMRGALQWD